MALWPSIGKEMFPCIFIGVVFFIVVFEVDIPFPKSVWEVPDHGPFLYFVHIYFAYKYTVAAL